MDKRLGETLGQVALLKDQLRMERKKCDDKVFECGKLQQKIDELKPESFQGQSNHEHTMKILDEYRLKDQRKMLLLEQNEEKLSEYQQKVDSQEKKLNSQAKQMEEYRIALVEETCKREFLQSKVDESANSSSQDSGQIAELLAEKKNLSMQLTEVKAELFDVQNESLKFHQETEKNYGSVESFVKPYLALAEKVLACESTKDKVQKFLPLNRMENQMRLIRQVGRDQAFATELYNGMRLYKSTTKEPLTQADRDLVQAVNVFYRLNDGFDYDVMVIPSVGDKFSKMTHQDLEKASSSAFLGFSEIYVPALMTDEKTVSFKAIVKGKT